MDNELYIKIKQIVLECGDILINADNIKISNKEGNNNIVTNYDLLIQNK